MLKPLTLLLIVLLAGCGAKDNAAQSGKSLPDVSSPGLPSVLNDPYATIVCRPVPFSLKGTNFLPLPIIACIKTETLQATVAEIVSDSEQAFSRSVMVAAKFLTAIQQNETTAAVALMADPSMLPDPSQFVTLMLGKPDEFVVERCVYVGKHAFVSVRGEADRPSNGVIPINVESQRVEFGENYRVLGSDAGQFVSILEFAIRSDPEAFQGIEVGNGETLANAFGDEGGTPVTIKLAGEAKLDDIHSENEGLGRAIADYERIWSSFAKQDYGAFAAGLVDPADRHFQRQQQNEANFSAFLAWNDVKRNVRRAAILNDVAVLLVRCETSYGSGADIAVLRANEDNGFSLCSFETIDIPLRVTLQKAIRSWDAD